MGQLERPHSSLGYQAQQAIGPFDFLMHRAIDAWELGE